MIGLLSDPAHWTGSDGIPTRIARAPRASSGSLLLAALIAVPLGLWVGHTGRGRFVAVNMAGAARALPSLGLLFLVGLAQAALQGDAAYVVPTLVVLVILAVPPILSGATPGSRASTRPRVTPPGAWA